MGETRFRSSGFGLWRLFAVLLFWVFLSGCSRPSEPDPAAAPPEAQPSELVRVDDRLHLAGEESPFTGTMVEHYPDGAVKARSELKDGVLHGVSEGWHSNGALQASEHFVNGVSHGTRYRWFDDGTPHTQAEIAQGKLHGAFLRWHENGELAERIEMKHGKPDGVSLAYFASGYLKASVEMEQGQVVRQQFWKDGEMRRSLSSN